MAFNADHSNEIFSERTKAREHEEKETYEIGFDVMLQI